MRQALALDAQAQCFHGSVQSSGVVARLERRADLFADDAFGCQIGHRTFQGFGYFDAHTSVVFGHDDDHSVAHIAATDLPLIGHALRVRGDVFRCRGGHDEHHHLRAALLL